MCGQRSTFSCQWHPHINIETKTTKRARTRDKIKSKFVLWFRTRQHTTNKMSNFIFISIRRRIISIICVLLPRKSVDVIVCAYVRSPGNRKSVRVARKTIFSTIKTKSESPKRKEEKQSNGLFRLQIGKTMAIALFIYFGIGQFRKYRDCEGERAKILSIYCCGLAEIREIKSENNLFILPHFGESKTTPVIVLLTNDGRAYIVFDQTQ